MFVMNISIIMKAEIQPRFIYLLFFIPAPQSLEFLDNFLTQALLAEPTRLELESQGVTENHKQANLRSLRISSSINDTTM